MNQNTYKNETIKRKYYGFLDSSEGFSRETIDAHEKAIWLWEDHTKEADFAGFNMTTARAFRDWLKEKKKARSDDRVSLSYCYDMIRHLKDFFTWLSEQPSYKSKINKTAIAYLSLSRADIKKALQPKNTGYPSLEEIKSVIENIKGTFEIDMRDKALISLTFLTGARISAIISLPIRSYDKKQQTIDQDPKMGVKTKNSKHITTAIIPFTYKEPLQYFATWVDYLVNQKGFKPTDPIFPSTKLEKKENSLSYYNAGNVSNEYWSNATPARKIFEKRFEQAGVKYYHPHTLRHALVKELSKLPLTEEEKKAVSQNLGHEHIGTTFGSYGYGQIEENRQIEIVRNLDFEGKKREIRYSLTKEELIELLRENE